MMNVDNITDNIASALRLNILTGPIFDKELRIASRRKRNYLLRVLYVLALLLFIILIWAEEVRYGGSYVYNASRISQAGLLITAVVVGLQFYVAQFLAIIMLSNSISDEIYNKTLGILMSTPISSLQIVMGKLLSKLLQIILLIAVTLPILGIIRVFGGIPWSFLFATTCLTMTAVIFAGLLSLNISIRQKHTYAVIVRAIAILVFLYLLIPWLVVLLVAVHFEWTTIDKVMEYLFILDPLVTVQYLLMELVDPTMTPVLLFQWYWNCIIMLGASTLLFLRAVRIVRKTALLQACGQLETDGPKFFRKWAKASDSQDRLKRVKGQPIIWKELRRPMFKGGLLRKLLTVLLIMAIFTFSR